MMEQIKQHSGFVEVNRIRLHYVEAGAGPAVIFCHGFPELWLSWRHQIPALAAAGYRPIALDMRGHGSSDAPERIEDYSVLHTVGDVIGLMDALAIDHAVIVGHDAGTTTAYHAALMRPDRVRGVVGLSVPYLPRGDRSLIGALRAAVPPGFYILFFQEPGVAERDLDADPRETLKRLFYANSGDYAEAPIMMIVPEGGSLLGSLPTPPGPISFVPDAVLQSYAESYARTGFRGGLNGYRVFDLNWALTAPWHGMALPVPAAFIGGTVDTVLHFPGFREAAERMGDVTLLEGAGHWIHAEQPEAVNAALLRFLSACL
ncbi:MAG: alpha/beta hydrolase [Pseudomonadota bacterium]